MFQLQMLGHFHLLHDDAPVTTIHQARLQSLLAYLILHAEAPQFRRHLAFLFWPDSTEEQARTNLRRALHHLRLALPNGDQYLKMGGQEVQWRGEAALMLDVSDFERLIARAEEAAQSHRSEEVEAALEQAVALYRGPFLPNCYEEWVLTRRKELADRYIQALDHLIALLEGRRKYREAIAYAQRLLRHDPLRETTYHVLMRLYALSGDRAGALRIFHECVTVLADELGVEPSAETLAAHLHLLKDNHTPAPSLQAVARPSDLSLLIGRQAEWQQLILAWQQTIQGHAHVVAITGEAGIGKTRLAEAFAEWVRRQGERVASARAYEAEGPLAFSPLGELLRAESLVSSFSQLNDLWLAQVARLLPELLERHPTLARPEAAADPLQRQHFLEALARVLLAENLPILILLDDLQWADREALEWLHFLLRYAPRSRLLLIVTIRSGEVAADHPLHHLLLSLRQMEVLSEIALDAFNLADSAALAAQIAGRALEAGQFSQLYRQSGGNPFFVVELTRANVAHWAAGGEAPPTRTTPLAQEIGSSKLSLPDRVQAVIEARLARLTPLAQEVAQLAATVGRSFTLELLLRAGSYSDKDVIRSLEELWERNLVRDGNANTYDFAHPILREVAYRQSSPLRRRLLHRQVAEALKAGDFIRPNAASGFIATHYQLAGDAARAVTAFQDAAHFAQQTYAYDDAADTLRKALALLHTLPEEPTRDRQEVALLLDLGWTLAFTKLWTDLEAQQAYERARDLSRSADSDVRLFEMFWGLHQIYLFQGKAEKSKTAADRCWLLAQQSGDPELLLQAHHAYWGIYHWFYGSAGGLQKQYDHAQQGVALYDPAWHRSHYLRFGSHDPGVCAYMGVSASQWLLGYPDQALASQHASVALARQLGHIDSTAMTLDQLARLHCYRREPKQVLEAVEQAEELARQKDLPLESAQMLAFRGWAEGQIAPSAAAVSKVRQGVAMWQSMQQMVEQPFFLIMLAETEERSGRTDLARQAIAEALELVLASGEERFLAELYRLQGRYWLAGGDHARGQASLHEAIVIAQNQQAKSLELRAAVELSQLLAAEGRPGEAYELLAPLYSWFTEGFETVDLRVARKLLRTLAEH